MAEVKHTPGPLIVTNGGCQSVRNFLAVVRDFEDGTTSMPTAYVASEADATLYATAPDLYEALQDAAATIDGERFPKTAKRIADVLAKADGRLLARLNEAGGAK